VQLPRGDAGAQVGQPALDRVHAQPARSHDRFGDQDGERAGEGEPQQQGQGQP